jgi:membrane associated rhomboid family serine protease
MIPLRDESSSSAVPIVTILLIATNVAVFMYQAFFGPRGFEPYVLGLGLVPAALTGAGSLTFPEPLIPAPFTLVTSIFMHGGFGHILMNMWFLWIFGDNIEHALGSVRFVIFYLLCGVLASLAHVALHPASPVPLVGASGAIAGVLGGYFLLYPFHRISTLIFIVFFVRVVPIPAFFFLGFWFLIQVLQTPATGPVAWWAHIGGFVTGLIFVGTFLRRQRPRG